MKMITHNPVSQSYIIDRIISQLDPGIVKRLEADEIRDGICFMLSMEWVRCVALGDVDTAIRLNEKEFVDSNDILYRQIASNFFQYSANMGMSSIVNRAVSFLIGLSKKLQVAYPDKVLNSIPEIYEWYVNVCSGEMLNIDKFFNQLTPDGLVIHFEKKFDSDLGVYLVGSSDHQMAFACIEADEKSELLFYDPNFGVYRADSIYDIADHLKRNFRKKESFDICNVVTKECSTDDPEKKDLEEE